MSITITLPASIYKDNIGNTWATTDIGKNFYPITDDNARRTDESKKGNFIDYK